jgi:hypothetical protein
VKQCPGEIFQGRGKQQSASTPQEIANAMFKSGSKRGEHAG